MDALCVIAAPGAGTDELFAALAGAPDFACYPGCFGGGRAGGIDPAGWPLLRRLTGIGFTDERDPRLVDFIQARPAAWLDALEIATRDAGRRVMAFPLHHDELPPALVEREIMGRTGLRVVFVVRRQIDSFVAWRRAMALAQLSESGVGIRLKLQPDDFCHWMEAQERWYGLWRDYLKRRFLPCPVLRYESDIDRQPPEAVLRRFAAAAAQVGITLRPPGPPATRDAPPPVRVGTLSEDVRNWTIFSAEIFRRGLEKRAFGYPL